MPSPQTPLHSHDSHLDDLNPQQRQAVVHPIHEGLHVIAGAGTGKTTVIARRYQQLFHQLNEAGTYYPEHHLLTVTFTVKAAEEMKHRINKQLHLPPTESSRAASITTEHLNTDGWITHFHGLGHRLLRQHGEHIGLPRTFRVLDSAEREQGYNALIEKLSNPIDYPDLSAHIATALTRAQLEPLIQSDPLNINQLKTSFKTLATYDLLNALPPLIERIKSAGLSPKEFVDTATHQNIAIDSALTHFPRYGSDGVAFDGNQTLAEVWDTHLNRWQDSSYSIKGDDLGADEKMLKKQLDWLNNEWKVMVNGVGCHPLPRKVRTKVVEGDERAWELLIQSLPTDKSLIPVVATFYALYQYDLHQKGACDFDDLILRTLELFEAQPDILAQYQQQFKHIIVDEFQDTNDSQLKLIQRLLGNSGDSPDGSVQSHVTVVGDEKQSIYGFRYAQPENLNTLAQYCPTVTSLQLGINYRSASTILDVVNQYTENVLQLTDQTLKSGAKPLTETPASVEWITLCDLPDPEEAVPITSEPTTDGAPEKPTPQKKSSKPTLTVYQEAESRWIAQRIERFLSETTYVAKDIAILVPTHTKGQRLYEQLISAGIPAQTEKGFSLLTHPTAMGLQAWMLWLQNPHHTEALIRLMQLCFTDKQLYQLCQQRGKRGLTQLSLHTVIQSEAGQGIINQWAKADQQALQTLLNTHSHTRHTLKSEPLIETIESSATALGLLNEADPIEHYAGSGFLRWVQHHIQRERRYLTLGQVNQRIHQWQRLSSPVIEPTRPTDTERNSQAAHGGAVRILTIHAAKGLEFPVVFVSAVGKNDYHSPISGLIGFEPQFSPKPGFGVFLAKNPLIDGTGHSTHSFKKRLSDTLWNRPRHTAEAKRLFYVALTRAKEQLIVTRHTDAPSWTNLQEFTTNVALLNPTSHSLGPVFHELVPLHHVPMTQPIQTQIVDKKSETETKPILNTLVDESSKTIVPTVSPNIATISEAEQATAQRCPVEYQLKYLWKVSPNKTRQAPQSNEQRNDTNNLSERILNLRSAETLVDKPASVQCDTIPCGYHHLCPLKDQPHLE